MAKKIKMTVEAKMTILLKENNMNNIKIAFFDIDGTLLDMGKEKMSEKTIETLHRLKENNIIICIATGRTPVSLPKFPEVEFDAFLTFNGSYCFSKEQTIFSNPISERDVAKIIDNARLINRPVSLATKNRLAANGKDKDLVDYYAIAKVGVDIAEDFEEVAKEEIYQIMMGCYKEEYAHMMNGVENAKIAAWWDRAVDIIPGTSGKGKGIQKILEFYHLSKEEAIAFGDSNNDIEMLQAVGQGVAMENGSDELKQIADDICGHVKEDGIYHYCA